MAERLQKGITNAEYHRRPELSSSQLADFFDDPIVWYNRWKIRRWPHKSPTDAMRRGTLTHDIIEEGVEYFLADSEKRLGQLIKTIPPAVLNGQGHCKGKSWTSWKEENPARHYLKVGELNPFREILKNVQANKQARPFLECEDREVTIIWTDEDTGIKCRSKIDTLHPRCINDWKTCRENTPHAIEQECEKRHYARRLAFYRRGVRALTGESLPVNVSAIKSKPGFGCRTYEIAESWLQSADEDVSHALERMASFNIDDELSPDTVVLEQPYQSYEVA